MVEAKHTLTCCSSGALQGLRTHQVDILTVGHAVTAEVTAFQAVFEEANRLHTCHSAYSVSIASLEERCSSACSSGANLSQPISRTAVLTGTSDLDATPCRPSQAQAWKRVLVSHDRVVACSGGTFLLAALGLLDSCTAVVHWAMQQRFRERFPSIPCDGSTLYTEDRGITTCAGGVASFDCALTLVEQDFGSLLADNVARSLLLHHRRFGDTDQLSLLLKAQATVPDMLTKLLAWLPDHLKDDLSVELLASRAAMSQRNFARVFQQRTGLTPARYVERLRFEAAQSQLRHSCISLSQAAAASGFNTVETLRRVFLKRLGITPGQFRQGRTDPVPRQKKPLSQHQDCTRSGLLSTSQQPSFLAFQ